MPKGNVGFVAISAAAVCLAAGCAIYLSDRSFEHVTKIIEVAFLAIGLLSLLHIQRQTEISAKQAEISAEQSRLTATLSKGVFDQARESSKWHKLLSYHDYFKELVPAALLLKAHRTINACEISESMAEIKAMEKVNIDKIYETKGALLTLARYLDCYEGFCAAVHAGVVDKGYAYTLEATRVIRAWTVFEPLIRRLRASNRYSRCYLELERLGSAWRSQRESEIAEKNNKEGVREVFQERQD